MTSYLVSWIDTHTAHAGNGVLNLAQPITCMGDVTNLQQLLIDEQGMTSPVVMGFSRFDEEGR